METPFIESVGEEQRPAVQTFIDNSGATEEQLAGYKTFDEFLSGYKPPEPAKAPKFEGSWKQKLGDDLAQAPSMQKFEDTPEGLVKAAESYVNLEKLLGNEKVVLPKGPEDAEGIASFNKALGIPEKATDYKLVDVQLPGEMSKLTFNKEAFSEVVHKFGLTPTQATGLWKTYTEMSGGMYQAHTKVIQDKLNENINALRAEWGDAYAANIELGDMVISKFAEDQDMGDFLTAALSKDPAGMKFLAKLGSEFAENKVSGFQYKKFSVSPEEAKMEIDKITGDPLHAYNNLKAPDKEHDLAVEHMNRLIAISHGKKG